MNSVLHFIGSGYAFFAGSGSIVMAVILHAFGKMTWFWSATGYFLWGGIALVTVSAAPLPTMIYGALLCLTIWWRVMESRKPSGITWMRGLVTLAWLCAIAIELPHQFFPTLKIERERPVHVIGDSVTAGIGGNETCWPTLLKADGLLNVHDYSVPGATTAEAILQASEIPADGGVVLVEIGGNDLLGSTSGTQFRVELERLLGMVCSHHRQVVMLELPLPPFCNAFGAAQRDLAAKYSVTLVPKRCFMKILSNGTTDTIHLSQEGHRAMAELFSRLLGFTG